MEREMVVGLWCKRCRSVMAMHRTDCPCQINMGQAESVKFRNANWQPSYVKVTVTMENANL
jgi:hypothetical protein